MVVRIRVPAKINLWLEVLRKRDDNYHDLSSLMLPVGVYDGVGLELMDGGGVRLESDSTEVPADRRNLAWRAAEFYLEAAGISSGVSIRLEKNIPVGAGLGGGSADAAGVLLGLNQLTEGRLAMDDLHVLAGRLGADVPFFLYQVPALATGIGEKLQRVEGVPNYPMVLIKPPVSVSTRWVYQSLKLTRGESRIKLRTFLARRWNLHDFLQNDLETVTLREFPLLVQIKEWFGEAGSTGSLMSGSGPTVFGIFPDRERAEGAGVLACRVWKDCWVKVTESLGTPDSIQA